MPGPTRSACAALLALGVAGAAAQAPSRGPDYQCLSLTILPVGSATNGTRLDQLVERLPEASKLCEEGIRIRPREARMHAKLARVRALSGDRAGAIAEARRAVELSPSESEAVVLLATLQARDDPAGALRQFREAARLGDKIATYNLGVMWFNGLGVSRDAQDAANFFRNAARAGDTVAMLVIGQLHAQGAGVPQDRKQAEDWWRKAAEGWQPEAVPDPARLVLAEPVLDTQALLAFYRERAQAGEAWAQAWLGLLHDAGVWMPRDPAAAAFWYAKAGEAGHRESQYRLANMYRLGIGVPPDPLESRRWAQMPQQAACRQEMEKMAGADECDRLAGDPYQPGRTVVGLHAQCVAFHAQEAVAACRRATTQHPGEPRFRAQYARSLAIAGRYEEASREAKVAAGKGSTPAMVLLARGVPRDEREAVRWLSAAAEQGHAGAQRDAAEAYYALAQKYARGDGVPKDEHQEMNALFGAAFFGHPLAIAAITARGGPGALAMITRRGPKPVRPPLPSGIDEKPDGESRRYMAVRMASAGSVQAVGLDAGIGNVYTVIPWTAIDEKNRQATEKR